MKSSSNIRIIYSVIGVLMITAGDVNANSQWKTVAHLTSMRVPNGMSNLVSKNFQINPSQCEYRLSYRYSQPAPCFSSSCSSSSSIGTAVLNAHHVRALNQGAAELLFPLPGKNIGIVTSGGSGGNGYSGGSIFSGMSSGSGTSGPMSGMGPMPGTGPSSPSLNLSQLGIQFVPDLNKYRVYISFISAGSMSGIMGSPSYNQPLLGSLLAPQVLGVRLEQRCDEASPNDGGTGPLNSNPTSSR